MIRLVPVFLLSFACYFIYVQALECGITEQIADENLQNVLRKCTGTKSSDPKEKTDKSTSDSSESSEEKVHQTYSASRGVLASRVKRNALHKEINGRCGSIDCVNSHKTIKRDVNSTSAHEEEKADHSGQNLNDTTKEQKCVLQCIFNGLGMVDGNGYPEHHLVAEMLLKNARGRELRDFIQDSTDECFQLMEQGEKLDTCDYSTHLISCLAEKGRSNCADWQIMTSPFQI